MSTASFGAYTMSESTQEVPKEGMMNEEEEEEHEEEEAEPVAVGRRGKQGKKRTRKL